MNEGNLDSNDPGTCARDNGGKVKFSLVPMHLLAGVARVLMHGEKKYKAWNWAKGGRWSQSFDCCMRHMFKFWYCRKDSDDESTLHHIDHAICNLLFLRHNILSYPAGDDRPPVHTMMEGEVDWVGELFPNRDEEDKTETYQYWVDSDGRKYSANPLANRFTTPQTYPTSAEVKDAQAEGRSIRGNIKKEENNADWTDATLEAPREAVAGDGAPVLHENEECDRGNSCYNDWIDCWQECGPPPAGSILINGRYWLSLDGVKYPVDQAREGEKAVAGQVFGIDYWIIKTHPTSAEVKDAQAKDRSVQLKHRTDLYFTDRHGYDGGYHHEGGITETNEEGFSDHA